MDFGYQIDTPKFWVYNILINIIWMAVIEQLLFKTDVK